MDEPVCFHFNRALPSPGARTKPAFLVTTMALVAVAVFPASLRGQTAGLVAAYSFDQGAGGTVIDSSGNGNTGPILNATWSTSGKNGSGLVFNGNNARVNVNDSASLHLTTAMTLEAWLNPASVNTSWR